MARTPTLIMITALGLLVCWALGGALADIAGAADEPLEAENAGAPPTTAAELHEAVLAKRRRSTADHSEFTQLTDEGLRRGAFEWDLIAAGEEPREPTAEDLASVKVEGPDVTRACLDCHTEASKQIMKTSHWTWICPTAAAELAERGFEDPGDKPVVGKGEHIVNNFCIALGSNEPRCTSCHAGYGWTDKTTRPKIPQEDWTDQQVMAEEMRVDCLVCHDTTGKYRKYPTGAGHPVYAEEGKEWPKGSGKIWPKADLPRFAQNVGKPSRDNCGTCHFFGGGGEGVKHGDMDVTLSQPDRVIDVHMATTDDEGKNVLDFLCQDCHTTTEHHIAGRCFTVPAYDEREYQIRGTRTLEGDAENFLACEACHGEAPHKRIDKLNDHTDVVSCQACHIPTLARRKPTKMWWDWSKAGRKEGPPVENYDVTSGAHPDEVPALSAQNYNKKKGAFIWAMDAVPEYRWFTGEVEHTFLGDAIDDQTPAKDRAEKDWVAKGAYDELDMSKPVVTINPLKQNLDDPKLRIWPFKVHRGIQPYDTKSKQLAVVNLFPWPKTDSDAYWKKYDWNAAIQSGMDYVGQEYSGEYDFIPDRNVLAVGTHGVAH
jgi:octaheme c-type cytochrome (tetrathionate reductase family)